jgi:hypothetical protein
MRTPRAIDNRLHTLRGWDHRSNDAEDDGVHARMLRCMVVLWSIQMSVVQKAAGVKGKLGGRCEAWEGGEDHRAAAYRQASPACMLA